MTIMRAEADICNFSVTHLSSLSRDNWPIFRFRVASPGRGLGIGRLAISSHLRHICDEHLLSVEIFE